MLLILLSMKRMDILLLLLVINIRYKINISNYIMLNFNFIFNL